MPPNDKRGRVHTSTVTVAVLDATAGADGDAFGLDLNEVSIRTTRDTGPGGQHRNKTESCVVATHLPTGLQAKAAARCQHQNRREALAVLTERVREHYAAQARCGRASERRQQVGSGQRGDKVRTYREQDDRVSDHRTGKTASLRNVLNGRLELVH